MITAFIHTHAAKIMKILSDFIAVILFFVAYQITGNMITATTVAVVTGVIQAVYTFAVHKKLAPTQWLSLVLVVVFGGLTIWLNDRSFIMLKKTILPWTMASAIGVMQLMGKNGLKLLLGGEVTLPDEVWRKISFAWMIFFFFLGAVNLAVAYPFTAEREAFWVQFSLWGYLPMTLVFSLAQAIYLVKHLPKDEE